MIPLAFLHQGAVRLPTPDSLFERAGWFYAFLRTRVFRNDAESIACALQLGRRVPGASSAPVLLEVGCGPGFYACRLAQRFPHWRVLGIDRSHDQLRRARLAARRSGLENCWFEYSDALALDHADASVDGLFASRLFTVLTGGELTAVLSEMHRVLRPGGRCFLAEPRSRWRAAIPLFLLRFLARLNTGAAAHGQPRCEPHWPTVLASECFNALVASQPWAEIRCWQDGHYQYALVQKHGAATISSEGASGQGGSAP